MSSSSSSSVTSSGGNGRWAEGKIALVTGATKGIGYSIAERLGLCGAHVIICSRDQANVDSAVKSLRERNIKVTGLAIHVGTKEERGKLIQAALAVSGEKKKIDILVSNVAVNPMYGPMLSVTDEKKWDKVMDVNVKSHFFLIQETVPYIPKGGSIVIISSYAGYTPNPLLGVYSVSKTALISLTKVLSTELAHKKHQIRINCIAPGVIKTKFSEQLWKGKEDASSQDDSNLLKNIPMQRYGEPHEIGSLACFLASDDASYITGETIVVGGGIQSRL